MDGGAFPSKEGDWPVHGHGGVGVNAILFECSHRKIAPDPRKDTGGGGRNRIGYTDGLSDYHPE